jgi:hypothetical protein
VCCVVSRCRTAHHEAALLAGETGSDDLLVREPMRHLGDHDHDPRNSDESATCPPSRKRQLSKQRPISIRDLFGQLIAASDGKSASGLAWAAASARTSSSWPRPGQVLSRFWRSRLVVVGDRATAWELS